MYFKLRRMRKENKYTVQVMADTLNISKPFYSQLETGCRRLSYDMAVNIAKIFDCKPDEIFYEDHLRKTKK